jgi:hypothetical protein
MPYRNDFGDGPDRNYDPNYRGYTGPYQWAGVGYNPDQWGWRGWEGRYASGRYGNYEPYYGNYGYGAAGYGAGGNYYNRPGRGATRENYTNYAGRGPRNYRRSDERIREDVNDYLARNPDLDATDVDVRVDNGEVTLSGVVEDRGAKRLAEDIADDVSGVTDVHNDLKIRHGLFAGVTGEKATDREVDIANQREGSSGSTRHGNRSTTTSGARTTAERTAT